MLKNYVDYTGSIADKNLARKRLIYTRTKRRAKAQGRTFGDEVDSEEGRVRIAEKRGARRTRVGQWPGYK